MSSVFKTADGRRADQWDVGSRRLGDRNLTATTPTRGDGTVMLAGFAPRTV